MQLMIRQLGLSEYEPVWKSMQAYTLARDKTSHDEIWFVQHPPVYTMGQNAKQEHLLNESPVPLVEVDRGGQVTYHGPGQIVAYVLFDIQRKGWGVREFVSHIEQAIIDLLADYHIQAERQSGAPGVYVDDKKIAALGLRIKKGCSYHGLSLNVDMDLSPFDDINPCGYPGLEVTQLKDLGIDKDINDIQAELLTHLQGNLGYNSHSVVTE